MDNLYAVIFAGGTGTRLWPVSRQNSPKQLKPFLGSEETLIQKTWSRIRTILPPQNIYISTVKGYEEFLLAQLPEFLADNLIVEPELRNTCPAIGLATTIVAKQHPGALMMNVWADHYYADEEEWRSILVRSHQILSKSPEIIMSVGIPIAYPCTGYGYLEVELQPIEEGVYQVKRFIEKPNLTDAEKFMAAGNFFWNPAIWMWQVDHMLELYQQLVPDIYEGLMKIQSTWGTADAAKTLQTIYPTFTKIAVDYAIFEKGPEMYLLPADLGWRDVGSWQAVHEVLNDDQTTPPTPPRTPGRMGGVTIKGKGIALNCQNTLIFNEDDKLVTVVGLEDVAVINTKDALLVIKKSQDQEVKALVQELAEKEMTEYL